MIFVNLYYLLKFAVIAYSISLPFLYDLNERYRCVIRYGFFYACSYIAAICSFPFSFKKGTRKVQLLISEEFGIFISKFLNIKWSLQGAEYLNLNNQPCVFMINRQNPIDILGMAVVQSHIRGNNTQLVSWTFQTLNLNFEGSGKRKNVSSLLVFPHTILDDAAHTPILRKEILRVIAAKNAPIIPIVFSNYYFIDERKKIFESGHVSIKVLPPIKRRMTMFKNISSLSESIRSVIAVEYEIESKRMTPPTVQQLYRFYASK